MVRFTTAVFVNNDSKCSAPRFLCIAYWSVVSRQRFDSDNKTQTPQEVKETNSRVFTRQIRAAVFRQTSENGGVVKGKKKRLEKPTALGFRTLLST